MIFTFLSIFVSSSCLSADPDDWSALKSTKNRVAKVIKTAKKNYFHEFFRVNEHKISKGKLVCAQEPFW